MDKLLRDIKPGGGFDCSGHEIVKFSVLREGSKAKSRISALDFMNADFGLFMDLLERILQDTVLEICPGKLADFQGSPSPSSRTIQPHEQKMMQRQQEA